MNHGYSGAGTGSLRTAALGCTLEASTRQEILGLGQRGGIWEKDFVKKVYRYSKASHKLPITTQ